MEKVIFNFGDGFLEQLLQSQNLIAQSGFWKVIFLIWKTGVDR